MVKAEASSHRIQVLTDAGVIMDFPCSYGEGDLPRNVTRSGIHVVTEKYEDFYMTNPAAGYSNVHERFAVRISNNGEFIHANPTSSGAQGNTNVTNGCINLSTEDAQQYFNSAIYGDPVEVTGTSIELSYADGDIWDWAVPWDEWMSMSALSRAGSADARSPAPRRPPRRMRRRCPARPTTTPRHGARFGYSLAVEPARADLIARPDHDQVQVDVRRARRDEPDHLGDVLGHQRGDALVDLASARSSSPSNRRSEKSVFTMPGAISVSRTGFPSSSPRSVRCSAPWACLAEV